MKDVSQCTCVLLALCSRKSTALHLRTPAWKQTAPGQARPVSSRLSYPFNLEDLPDVGTENKVAGTFVSLYPAVFTYKFHILFFFFFSVWPPSLRKDEVPEKSTRNFSDLSPALVPRHPAVTCFTGTFLLVPAHNKLPLLSTRYCVSSSGACLGVHHKLLPAPCCCFLLCMGARLLVFLNHTDLGSDISSATNWLGGSLNIGFVC